VNANPPPPVPSSTPIPRRSSSAKSLGKSFASSSASRAAASARGTVRGTCLRSRGFSCASQSKSGTSAAILTGEFETSNDCIFRTPLLPATSPSQNFSRPIPSGVTQPMPVMTTRRGRLSALSMQSSSRIEVYFRGGKKDSTWSDATCNAGEDGRDVLIYVRQAVSLSWRGVQEPLTE